jgi:hypothetical protein
MHSGWTTVWASAWRPGPLQKAARGAVAWRGARRARSRRGYRAQDGAMARLPTARWRLAGGKVMSVSLRGAQGGRRARRSVVEPTRAVVRRGGGGELQASAFNGGETALVTGGNAGVALQYQGGRGKVRRKTIGSNNTRRSGSLRRQKSTSAVARTPGDEASRRPEDGTDMLGGETRGGGTAAWSREKEERGGGSGATTSGSRVAVEGDSSRARWRRVAEHGRAAGHGQHSAGATDKRGLGSTVPGGTI